ncbi:MAG: chaperonin GroEL [Candidatus Eisenbacteria bacterium]
MAKRVQFDDAARHALWRGVDQLACAVRITLGPRGRSVALHKAHTTPTITRDGIAVAQEIELPDAFENLGVQMLREVALQTGQTAGDGTSTATVLAHCIFGAGMQAIAAGHNPMALKRGIDRAVSEAVRALAANARPVAEPRDLERVAVVAAGDRMLGELVAHALERVGPHGVVTVEEGKGVNTTLEVVEGVRFEGGYASPYFITSPEEMECELAHPLVLLVDGRLTDAMQLVPALEIASRSARPLLVLCEEIEGEALATLVVNRLRGRIPSCSVKLSGTTAQRRILFDDLALLTGARVVAVDTGLSVGQVTPDWLGRAKHVQVGANETTLLQGGGHNGDLHSRLVGLRADYAAADNASSREALRTRLARLGGVVAVIRVGGTCELEMHERRSRVEDALGATRAAVEEGIVTGGGVALLRTMDRVRKLDLVRSEAAGRDIVLEALAEPARIIAMNAGVEGGVAVERARSADGAFGFNALSLTFCDLGEAGVVDAAKVMRCALQNAASIGTLMLTTDALVVDDGESDTTDDGKGGEAA